MIYFIQCGDDGPIKIGYTTVSAKERLVSLQSAHHTKLVLLACIAGTFEDERALHERFAADRLRGEWFSVSAALTHYIAKAPRVSHIAPNEEYLTTHNTLTKERSNFSAPWDALLPTQTRGAR